MAGCEREIIEESGYTAIFNISGGIPRKNKHDSIIIINARISKKRKNNKLMRR